MNTETIKEALRALHLSAMAEALDAALTKAAQDNLSHAQFLALLVSEEQAVRHQRLVKSRTVQANFPVIKTIDSFDFRFPKSILKNQILNLLDLAFVPQKQNVIFLGPPGTGKTHLALSLGYVACQKGYKTLFTTAMNLINTLSASLADNSFLKAMKTFTAPRLLIIDELGFLPIDRTGVDLLYQVISNRYETGSVVSTTNRAFRDWGTLLNNDNTLASAVIDRLVHHGTLIQIKGESYRVKE